MAHYQNGLDITPEAVAPQLQQPHPSLVRLSHVVRPEDYTEKLHNIDDEITPDDVIKLLKELPIGEFTLHDFHELSKIAFNIHDGRKLTILRQASLAFSARIKKIDPTIDDIVQVTHTFRNFFSMTVRVASSVSDWLSSNVAMHDVPPLVPIQILKGIHEGVTFAKGKIELHDEDYHLIDVCSDKLIEIIRQDKATRETSEEGELSVRRMAPMDYSRGLVSLSGLAEKNILGDQGYILIDELCGAVDPDYVYTHIEASECTSMLIGLSHIDRVSANQSVARLVNALYKQIANSVDTLRSNEAGKVVSSSFRLYEMGIAEPSMELLQKVEHHLISIVRESSGAFSLPQSQGFINALYYFVQIGGLGESYAQEIAKKVTLLKPVSPVAYAHLAVGLAHYGYEEEAKLVCAASDQLSLDDFRSWGHKMPASLGRVALTVGYEYCPEKAEYLEERAEKSRKRLLYKMSNLESDLCEVLQSLNLPFEREKLVGLYFFDFAVSFADQEILLEIGDLAHHFRGGIRANGRDPEDLQKEKFCKRLGISVAEIFSDEWINLSFEERQELVLERLAGVVVGGSENPQVANS